MPGLWLRFAVVGAGLMPGPPLPGCGFALNHYRDILEVFRRDFEVLRFRDVVDSPSSSRRRVILRHDIDMAVEPAVEMARVEHEAGVRATYFVRVDARYYNPFHLPWLRGLRQILAWGHDIGLHFSTASAPDMGVDPARVVAAQAAALRDLLGCDPVVGAPHETSRLALAEDDVWRRAGLRAGAYEPRFVREMDYLSDSAGRWREGCVCTRLGDGRDLCVLTHPFWWFANTPLERY